MAKRYEFYYDSTKKDAKIRAVKWLPDKGRPIGVVQIAHGIAEHIVRYDEFATYLASRGFLVVGNDHLGHGKSIATSDELGFFSDTDGWNTAVNDMYKLYELIHNEYSNLPYVLFGHSMGSFLARTFVIEHPDVLNACIISGTGNQPKLLCTLGIAAASLERKRLGDMGRSRLVNTLMFGTYNKRISEPKTASDWLTRDSSIVERYISDEKCGFIATVSLVMDMLGGIRYITDKENVRKMRADLPIFLISGEADPVGDYGKGVRKAYNLLLDAGCTDVRLKLYPRGRHEMLNELNRQEVYTDILNFINAKCF